MVTPTAAGNSGTAAATARPKKNDRLLQGWKEFVGFAMVSP
jgi:hypothetical protein